jgi:hypothetical protein
VTRCTIRRPEPTAFQRLLAAVVAADEQRIEDAAVRVVRDRLRTKPKKPKAKHCRDHASLVGRL